MARCKCKNARIVSDVVQNICQTNNGMNGALNCGCGSSCGNIANCVCNTGCGVGDICTNPIIGSPDVLSLFAPVIYDEVGINLCTTFDLGADLPTAFPTATWAMVRVTDITFTYGDAEGEVSATPIAGRPNCYLITLSNLTVTFAVDLFDAACRLVTTVYPTAVYLPSAITDPTYDADTNPSVVELELFAPYGIASVVPEGGTGTPTPTINVIGFSSANNFLRQGINMYAIPKLINLDTEDSSVTIGITLVLQSLYYAGYCVESSGKINTPKGNLSTSETSDCMQFVEGGLLNLAIRPLDLCSCEAVMKAQINVAGNTEGIDERFETNSNCGCNTCN